MDFDFFSEEEFYACVPSCEKADMDKSLLARLNQLRSIYGRPIVLTSAYRSRDYELSKNRSGTSQHTLGKAVDVYIPSQYRYEFVRLAMMFKFSVGIYSKFIHLDIREIPVIFVGD